MLNVSSPVTSLQRFHLALPVDDLSSACEFYETRLNCPSLHREDSIRSAGFDFFGHELVLHVVSREDATDHRRASGGANAVVRHFGIYLRRSKWEEAIGSLAGYEGGILGPLDGPQGSYLLVEDPAGNVIELKTDEPGKEG